MTKQKSIKKVKISNKRKAMIEIKLTKIKKVRGIQIIN